MKLYEIQQQILDCVDTETGEVIDVDELEALNIERDAKIKSLGEWYINLKADAEAYKNEKDKFADREKAAKNKAERIKSYLDTILNGEKFQSVTVTISYRKSESVEIDDIWKLPEQYLKFADPTPDKTLIKEAIKGGESIEGAHIVINQNIQIK